MTIICEVSILQLKFQHHLLLRDHSCYDSLRATYEALAMASISLSLD